MREWFLFFLLHCSPWMIASVIVNLQLLPVIESFRIAHHTGFGTRRATVTSFSVGSTTRFPPFGESDTKPMGTFLLDKQQDNDDDTNIQTGETEEQVEVGTKEYYSGFLSSPVKDETVAERGSGLEQALKLGGGVALILIVLVAGFLASNGII